MRSLLAVGWSGRGGYDELPRIKLGHRFGRHARDDRERLDVARDQRVGDDDCSSSDANPGKDRALGTEPDVVFDDHRARLGQQLSLVEVVEGGVVDRDVRGDLDAFLRSPLADARPLGVSERSARDVLAVITASYEEHGGFRLRTLKAG